MERDFYFDHDMTNCIKGVAVIMMLILHFLTVPQWRLPEFAFSNLDRFSQYYFQRFELCVPIFACLTGLFNGNRSRCDFRYAFKKITDLLIAYWITFLLLSIITVFLGSFPFSFGGFLLELVGYHREIMVFCWYVFFYITAMLTLALLDRTSNDYLFLSFLIYVVMPTLISAAMLFWLRNSDPDTIELTNYYYKTFQCMGMGYIIGKYDLFHRLFDRVIKDHFQNKWTCVPVLLALLYIAFIGRFYLGEITLVTLNMQGESIPVILRLDILYAPLFIYALANLLGYFRNRILLLPLKELGRVSMEIWFVHCVFFADSTKLIFMPILYRAGHPVAIVLWGVFLCYTVSVVIDIPIRALIHQKNILF